MFHRPPITLLALLVWMCSFTTVEACKYTVRDVAFVDLGEQLYRLFLVTKEGDHDSLSAALGQAAKSVLSDANVVAELVELDKTSDHAAADYALSAGVTTYPAAILVSPDDRSLQLPWEVSAESDVKQLKTLLGKLVESPRRKEIFGQVLDVHSVILVIDGNDEAINDEVKELAEQLIPQVSDALELMPKPIKHPPHLIHLTQEEARTEQILLWSLGVELADTSPAQIALVFGRGRQLGPVLRFPEDKHQQLIHSLSVVGQDCECGLDRRWMQGQMIPHAWTSDDEVTAMQKLNFDPGNPLVKMEIDRILRRGPGSSPGGRDSIQQPGEIAAALGYHEIVLDDLEEVDQERINPPQEQPAIVATDNDKPDPQQSVDKVVSTSSPENKTTVDATRPSADTENIPSTDKPETGSSEHVQAEEEAVDIQPANNASSNIALVGLVSLVLIVVVAGTAIMLRGPGA
ncbi:MAG: hypothetical protein N2C12_05490 [Planctomycetales bacterium]